jgi:flavodoxin
MPVFKLPLSGDVVQNISPFTAFMSPIGSQFGLINITLGQSSSPPVEGDVLTEYGTYGKQIGQIGDALLVLIERMPKDMKLDDEDAIKALKKMLNKVADIKERHKRPALRPRPVDSTQS